MPASCPDARARASPAFDAPSKVDSLPSLEWMRQLLTEVVWGPLDEILWVDTFRSSPKVVQQRSERGSGHWFVEVLRFGRVIGIMVIHESLGYLIPMGESQLTRGAGASRRIVTGVIVVTVAVLLLAGGCTTEPAPSTEEVVAAGDIASCRSEGDEATAELVEGIDGTVLALGDEAYPRGSAANFEECYGPSWGRFKERTRPVPGNHEYFTEGASGYFEYFGEAAGDPEEGYYSYELGYWHVVALNSNCEEVRCGLVLPRRGGSRRISPPTTSRSAPSLTCTIPASAPGRNMAPPLGGGEAVGGALRGGCRRGLLRPRAQLRALLPAGPAGEGRPREASASS